MKNLKTLLREELEKYSLGWLKEKMLDVPFRKPPYLYRAITVEELPEIRKNGLIPKKPRAFRGSKEDFNGVWLTEYNDLDFIFEVFLLPMARLKRAVLLKIDTKNLDPDKFVIGINFTGSMTYELSKGNKIGVNEYLQETGEIIYLDKISPQDIKVIDGPVEIKKNLKQSLREELEKTNNINSKDLTVDYFKQRIPFLKEYDVLISPDSRSHPTLKDAIKMRKTSFNKDFKTKIGDDIYTFPSFNISSEFNYSSNIIRDNVFYTFGIDNKFYMTRPENMDELLYRTFLSGSIFKEKEMSKIHELIVPVGEEIPKIKLDEIINDINGKIFKIEEFTNNLGIPLF